MLRNLTWLLLAAGTAVQNRGEKAAESRAAAKDGRKAAKNIHGAAADTEGAAEKVFTNAPFMV